MQEIDTIPARGGAGRGQGRKPIAPDAKPYKLLLPAEHRAKLDDLGGAEWIRSQLSLAIHLDNLNLEKAVNLSARYIKALRQLPQFMLDINPHGPLTHALTGVRIVPLGDLTDESDDSGILQLVYPGGHSIEVIGAAYLELMLCESAQIEVTISPEDLGIPARKFDFVQVRAAEMKEHLTRKHRLD